MFEIIKHWIKDSKILDKIEECLVYSKYKTTSNIGIWIWKSRSE